MRLLVTGSRNWVDDDQVYRTLDAALLTLRGAGTAPVTLVHGGCNMRPTRDGCAAYVDDPPRGADAIADYVWRSWGLPVEIHFADWERHGKAAGYIRNSEMVSRHADLVCAFWLDGSRGTGHTIQLARAAGLRLDVVERRTHPDRQRRHEYRPWEVTT